eukprot:CAMPEP_0113908728 /NCGR_PEP_ID=MMETSP0780_2-20120614/26359_1 /TAXON_ID=652834 /ORGANISM="Palpitomonas bilix" /LENGTH=120 /DNA_ID=CAMNT_0000904261 /DNA_START=95 /DNA_END=457 /DNA_ORIENTATION=- /assembly_acc=CAM_ASM_000599
MTDVEKFEKEVGIGARVFLFVGDKTPSATSWCPDCVEAFGPIESASTTYAGGIVTICVGNRDMWKGEEGAKNYFRVKLGITSIPTLAVLNPEGTNIAKMLVEEECRDEGKLQAFFDSLQK